MIAYFDAAKVFRATLRSKSGLFRQSSKQKCFTKKNTRLALLIIFSKY